MLRSKCPNIIEYINQESKKLILIDRDSTIIRDNGYIHNPNEINFLPKTLNFLRTATQRQIPIVIVTNQAGIGKNKFNYQDFSLFNARLIELLTNNRVKIFSVLFCPHHIDAVIENLKIECLFRKPNAGMLSFAMSKYQSDILSTIFIGDSEADLLAAKNANIPFFCVNKIEDFDWNFFNV